MSLARRFEDQMSANGNRNPSLRLSPSRFPLVHLICVRRNAIIAMLACSASVLTGGCAHRYPMGSLMAGERFAGGLLPLPNGKGTVACLTLRDAEGSEDDLFAYLESLPAPLEYPQGAAKARVRGIVEVEGVIAADGSVTDARVIRGLPMGLSETALSAVCALRFVGLPPLDRYSARRFRAIVYFDFVDWSC